MPRILGTQVTSQQLAMSLFAYSIPAVLLFSERLRGKSGWPITAVAGAFLVISIIAIQRHFFGRFADSEDGSAGAQEIMSRTRRRETRRGSTAMRHQNSSGAARITPFAEEKAEMSPSRRTPTPF